MRKQIIALVFFLLMVEARPLRAAEATIARRTLADRLQTVDVGGNNRDLVILQFARELGLLEGVTAEAVVARVDAARTDQQLTASSSTPGSVLKAERPGIPELLALAIERGAVIRETAGTNVTLSTTPYLLLSGFGSGDTPENWEALAWSRRLGVNATFSSEAVTTGDFSSFVSGEVKVILAGNRSGRDAAVLRNVSDDRLLKALAPHGVSCQPFLATEAGQVLDRQARQFDQSLVDTPTNDVEDRLATVVDPTSVMVDDDARAKLQGCLGTILNLQNAIEEDLEQLRIITDAYLALNSRNQLSAAFLYHRDPATSDYTTLKLLYGRELAAYRVSLNGEISFNQQSRTTTGTQLDRTRGYSVEAALNSGKMASRRADASLAMKWYDPHDTDDGYVLSGQALLNLHISDTFKFPVALTYANRTVTAANAREGLQLEFGLAALLDNLLGFARR